MAKRTIVAAVDFSPESERAARLAAEVARVRAASLVVVHASEPPILATVMVEPMFVPPQWLEALRRRHDHEVDAKLNLLVDRLRDDVPGVPIERHRHLGDPAMGVVETAKERGACLIVMSTRGAGASRFLLGSVTAKVCQHAPCPVLVSDRRGTGTPKARFPRVLAAIDYSELSRPVAQLAASFAENDGVIEVAHVWHEPRLGWLADRAEHEQVVASGLDHARRRLAHFVADASIAHPRVETWIGSGSPAGALLDRVDQTVVDLLVIGAHGRHGAARALGTHADRVLRHAMCALLVVPNTAAAEVAVDDLSPSPGAQP